MSGTSSALTRPQQLVILLLGAGLLLGSFAYYRYRYAATKRLRVVEAGKLYRSGQLSARGLEQAIRQFGIRTVINLREEAPNPNLAGEREAALCQRLGVRYIYLYCEDLTQTDRENGLWPESARLFLDIVGDPDNWPVLVHCQAGLHRTGLLCAIYRVVVQKWEPYRAWHELCANGYGEDRCAGISPGFRDYMLPLLHPRSPIHHDGLRTWKTSPAVPDGTPERHSGLAYPDGHRP